jgi:aminoglycoside phosphotransferase (APT) family kinase protein
MSDQHLNQPASNGHSAHSEAWERVYSRLGDYTESIVRHLNMRPTDMSLLTHTSRHLLLRVSTPSEHLVLRIAPESHLLCETFFGRTTKAHHIPAAHIVHFDTKRTVVPFDYIIESYVCGIGAHQLAAEAPHLLRAVARQAGRTLRQMHRVRVPGWGHPSAAGRWLEPDWPAVLERLHTTLAPLAMAALVFDSDEQAAVEALLRHPALSDVSPCLIHGAVGPHAVRCTVGDHVHLEALTEPGTVVAGDGLLDLAYGLNPTFPAGWCMGLLEGYTASTPLSEAEWERLRLLQLLTCYWATCQQYALAEPHQETYERTQALLAEHREEIERLLPTE